MKEEYTQYMWEDVSLASHILQSQEKEGLVTMRTMNCSSARNLGTTNQIRDSLLSNALLAAHAHIASPVRFAVAHEVFCNYCIPREQLIVTRPCFSLEIEGCG